MINFKKRAHSACWHLENRNRLNSGCTKDTANVHAGKFASVVMMKWCKKVTHLKPCSPFRSDATAQFPFFLRRVLADSVCDYSLVEKDHV